MGRRVLRLLRGRLRAVDAERLATRVRDDVFPSTASLDGLETSALGLREEGDALALLTFSLWRDGDALLGAGGEDAPTRAFATLLDIVSFEPPRAFDIVVGDWSERGALRTGAIGLVEVVVAPEREAAVHDLIRRQHDTLRADGFLWAFFVGRREHEGDVTIAAVAVWPDRDVLGTFLAGRSEGPGIDPRLEALAKSLRFEVVDLVDPGAPAPTLGSPAVFALDEQRTIVDASRGVARILGEPPEALLGRRFDDLLADGDRSRLDSRWAALLRDGTETDLVSMRRPDGAVLEARHESVAHVPAPGLHAVLLQSPDAARAEDVEAVVRSALGGWRATPAARRSTRNLPAPRLITLPSNDRLFARFASRMLDTFETPSMRRLQLHLRGVYPDAVVHRRELSAERETWYVFRDGRVGGVSLPDGWWRRPGIAWASVDRSGRISEANAAAPALYGVPHAQLIGRDIRGLGDGRAYEDFALLLTLAFAEQSSDSTIRLASPSGEPVDIVFHAQRTGPRLRFALAPRPATDAGRDWFAPLCLPPSDETFIGRVEDLCARLSPRDPDEVASELEMRLRIRYPHAIVQPLGRLTGFGPRTHVLLVQRDGHPDTVEHWWSAPGVATVRIERGRYVEANDRAVKLHGVSREELLSSPLGRFRMSGDERLLMGDVLHRTGALHTTTRLERGDGGTIEVEFRATLVSSEPQVVEVAMRRVNPDDAPSG